MRWEDERWIKVYTRDTADWLALSWKAQGLYGLIERKVDTAGTLDLGRRGKPGLSAHIGGPSAWAEMEPALDELIREGWVVLSGTTLVVPTFVDSQRATQSDKARKQRERERARDVALKGANVTNRDASVTNCDDGSQNVTKCHEESEAVTRCHALSRREEKRGEETRGEEKGGVGGHTPPPPAEGGTAKADPPEPAKPERPRRKRPEAMPDAIPMPGTAERALYDAILRDPLLRPIVVNPGDFASRMVDRFPSIDLVAATKDAGEWLGRATRPYTDGRGFLRNQYERAAKLEAGRPKPAPEPEGADPWSTARLVTVPRKEVVHG